MTKRKNNRRILAEAKSAGSVELTAAAIIGQAVEAGDDTPRKLPSVEIEAYNGGAMSVPGYPRPVVVDVSGVGGLGRPIPLLRGHDANRIVGHGVAAVDGGKILVAGTLSAENGDAGEITRLAGNGFPWQASIGLTPTKLQQVNDGASATVNGASIKGPATVVRAGKLREVSIVPMGADDTTTASVAAELEVIEMSDTKTVEAVAADEIKSESLQAIKAERARVESIEATAVKLIHAGQPIDVVEPEMLKAKATGISAQEFELRVLREGRNNYGNTPQRGQVKTEVVEAAVARAASMPGLEKAYSAEVLEASEREFKNGLTLVELMHMAAKRAGYHSTSFRATRELLRAAFQPIEARGASTYDLSGVLSNVANKAIAAGFDSVESTWRAVAKISSVTDFKQITNYALTGDFKYELVGNGGELKHATMSEETYTNQANTYGRIFSITRQDLTNDDLSAFDRVRNLIGRGGALKFNLVFWTEFLADVTTFYTTARGNYFEGAATNLQVSSLTTAEQKFFDQTDPDGNPLGVMPTTLLVPNALNVTATQLQNDAQVRDTTASTKYTTGNPHQGKFTTVRSSYLNNSNVANGSATHWFLLADPMDLPVIEAVFLNGRQQPFVEAADADFDQLGVQMRGYHDFGVSKQEYRGGVRSKGAA